MIIDHCDYEYLILLQDIDSGILHDITNVTTQVEYTTERMTGHPGTLELFLVVRPEDEYLSGLIMADANKHGHIIQFSINGVGVFMGYGTFIGSDATHIVKLRARDQMFYLKSRDILFTENMTASQIFTQVCNRKENIKHEVRVQSRAINDPYRYQDYTLFNMIDRAIDETIVKESEDRNLYIIRDEFGTLIFTELRQLNTDILLGDSEYAIGYMYESSIEEDTYNSIKIFRNNEDEGIRDIWIVQDSNSIAQWGKLQLLVEAEKAETDLELENLGRNLLEYHNVPDTTLSITAIGRLNAYAGNSIKLNLSKIGLTDLNRQFIIDSARHTFDMSGNRHIMELELLYKQIGTTDSSTIERIV